MPKISGGFGNIQQQKEHLERLIERLEKIKVPEVKEDKTLWQKIKDIMTYKIF